jgi:hypothetical protein
MTMMIMIITSGGGDDDCKHRMDHVGGPIEKLAILESCRFLAPGLGAGGWLARMINKLKSC